MLVAVQLYISAFNRHTRDQRDLENLDNRIRWVEQNRREEARKRQALAQAKRFIQHARASGLERHNWAHYDVNIEERLYFHEASRLLTQTANSESCYFHPISLNIKKTEGQTPMTSEQARATAGAGSDLQGGDLILSLKGTFVVRQK